MSPSIRSRRVLSLGVLILFPFAALFAGDPAGRLDPPALVQGASPAGTADAAGPVADTATPPVGAATPRASSSDKAPGLPTAYRGYTLGMGLDELKQVLASDELFTFRGDRDVSLLPQSEQVLIETTGLSFIRRAFFQLYSGKLFIMAFSLDTNLIDYYSVYSAMVAKYGDPATLNPREAVWLSDETRVSIERPLTVKYIDMKVFKKLQDESLVKESRGAVLRKEFLNDF